MSTIKVKYTGKKPWVICPYNGKKYVFRAKSRESEIPLEVFRHFSTFPEFQSMLVPVPTVQIVEKAVPAEKPVDDRAKREAEKRARLAERQKRIDERNAKKGGKNGKQENPASPDAVKP